MRRQQLAIDPRLEIKPFEKGGTGQLDQVLEAGAVLGQERQVVTGFLEPADLFFEAALRGDVRLVAHDRVDADLLAA